jgi:uncharacterized protein (UPF0332 family)
MSFNWVDYYTFAQELNTNTSTTYKEACYRTIISRAYYAIFWIARNYLQNRCGTVFSAKAAHRLVGEALACGCKEEKLLHHHYSPVKSKRNDADYEGRLNITENDAKIVCRKAGEALEILKNLGAKF